MTAELPRCYFLRLKTLDLDKASGIVIREPELKYECFAKNKQIAEAGMTVAGPLLSPTPARPTPTRFGICGAAFKICEFMFLKI